MDSSIGFQRLRAAAIDGRTENIRYRQNELQALHTVLRENVETICAAIINDAGAAAGYQVEAETEFSLTMSSVKHVYNSLDFEGLLKEEYHIANGEDNAGRRVGKGVVIIRPTSHTRFYSVITPIAAAVAAGNCVVLELEHTTMNIDSVLKEILPKALDLDTFFISTSRVQDSSILNSAFLVDQTGKTENLSDSQLVSTPSARAIAIVDRSANIESAAKSIVTARMSFQGNSPYSPDLVIVNDFTKDAFIEACLRQAHRFGASRSVNRRQQQGDNATKKAFKDAEAKSQLSAYVSKDFTLADVHEKTCDFTTLKISGSYLPITTTTSLVNSIMSDGKGHLLAAYLFADAPTAKFLAQHLNARLTCINHIPIHLLVGPAAPIYPASTSLEHRYTPEMFSSPRPQYINAPSESLRSVNSLFSGESDGVKVTTQKLRAIAVQPLAATGQPLGHAIGFFEQGILLGGGIFLTIVVPAISYSVWVLGRKAWEMGVRSKLS